MRERRLDFQVISFLVLTVASMNSEAGLEYEVETPVEFSTLVPVAPRVMADSTNHRDVYNRVGVILRVRVYSNEDGSDPSDRIQLLVSDAQTGEIVGRVHLEYSSNCFYLEGRPIICGVRDTGITYEFQLSANNQCALVKDFRITLARGFTFPPTEVFSERVYRPSQFPAKIFYVYTSGNGLVRIPQFPTNPNSPNNQIGLRNFAVSESGSSLTLEVYDSIQTGYSDTCAIRQQVPIILTNTVVPFSGGHRHFADPDQPGMGQYHLPASPGATTSPDGTTISGVTDDEGRFFALYHCCGLGSEFGRTEKVTIQITDLTGTESSVTQMLDFGAPYAPPLVSLDTDGELYGLAGTGGVCDTPHNASATNGTLRNTRFVTPKMYGLVSEMARRYLDDTGHKLSFNDASLPLGGVIDSGTTSPANPCHATHRMGIDIDVNVGGSCLNCTVNVPGQEPMLGVEYLDTIVDDLAGRKMVEGPVHYRFFYAWFY